MFLGDGFKSAVKGKVEKATDAAWEDFVVTSYDGKTQVDWLDGANAFTDSMANDNDDILKDFEAVDFFHGEHPGVMYSHRKLLIRKSESLTRHTGLKTIAWTFLMSHK